MAFAEKPRPYLVLLDMTCLRDGTESTRMFGTFSSPETARKNIRDNEKECRKLSIATHKRGYRIFRAAWTEITHDEVEA